MIIFDLDITLFNTPFLKADVKNSFAKGGVSEDDFWRTYRQAHDVDCRALGCYSAEKHLSVLSGLSGEQRKSIIDDLIKTAYQTGPKYLYPDALPLLEKLKQRKERMILITKGDKNFQELKIDISGIRDYFEKIHIVSDSQRKLSLIKDYTGRPEPVITVNDHAEELNLISQAFPDILCFFIERQDREKPATLAVPAIKELGSILIYLEPHNP